LSPETNVSPSAATERFISDVLNDRSVIVVAKVAGTIRDVWITDAPYFDKYKPDSEIMEFRYWSGLVLPSPKG